MTVSIELVARSAEGGGTHLVAPEVGLFTAGRPAGAIVQPGEVVGEIDRLGERFTLVVPAGTSGRIVSELPDRTHAPTEYGQVLYRLEPVGDVSAEIAAAAESGAHSDLAFASPITGRFWHRPAPDEPAFIAVGAILETGTVVGLVEIMKTFTQVSYTASGNLPARAKIVAIKVSDGGEVNAGDALFEVEPA
jgi:acetyl-CoA carboxylase biotin carboxyl carrier protein